MNRAKLIYYIAFPLITFGLCAFSYFLGWQRGKQWAEVGASQKPVESLLKEHESAQELTFFKTLKDDSPPVPTVKTEIPKPTPAEKVVTKPEVKPSPIADAVTEPSAPKVKKGFAIQVSAFRDIGKAHELVDQLKNGGFPAFTKTTHEMGGVLHRVFVGPYEEKSKASSVVAELKKKGFKEGFVTSVGGK